MQQAQVEVYIVPDNDPHLSEYIPEYWESRAWLSGFNGSTGTLMITQNAAHLWTDSRYFIQAEKQLEDTPYTLQKARKGIWNSIINWLKENVEQTTTIGCNGELFSLRSIEILHQQLPTISIITNLDLVTPIWENRPTLPSQRIFERPIQYSGKSRLEKIAEIQSVYLQSSNNYYLCTTLDDIAWILNLRGSDIHFNPVFLAYLVIGKSFSYLFVDPLKISNETALRLFEDSIEILPYEGLYEFIADHSLKPVQFLAHKTSINFKLAKSLPEKQITWEKNRIEELKAVKNQAEIKGSREAMIKDGIALTKLFFWLEQNLEEKTISEFDLSEQLMAFRSEQENYMGESFPAIVGYQSNGAIVHYRPEAEASSILQPEGLLLLDSGGQYLEGTTDITRTVALGKVSAEQKKHYSLVLKGHIALASARFPVGTMGIQLDALARSPLWKAGLNFGHGTGHGVGSFLNVHEGPHGISPTISRGSVPIKPGMITSNEPGFYLEAQYGIRIENLILCIEDEATDFGNFLAFETLSLFPYDLQLIDLNEMTAEEVKWINDYHKKVFATLGPLLDLQERDWLASKCIPISLETV